MERRARDISGKHASVLRRINSIQVFNALRLKPGISQRDIGGFTGIDRSTVSAIITHFHELGLLNRDLDETAGRRGRPSESLSLRADAGMLVGVHIVPERMLFVASGLDGKPFATQEAPPLQSAGEIGQAVEAGLREFYRYLDRDGEDAKAIGICMPGLISTLGILTESSNFRWQNIDLQQIAAHIGPHAYVGNDSRGAGLAEKLFGKCVDFEDYIYLDSASGVGGILFLDGHAYTGASGFAGEMGHVKVVPNGRLCQCGSLGCISAYVSEPALVRRFSQLGLSCEAPLSRCGHWPVPATPRHWPLSKRPARCWALPWPTTSICSTRLRLCWAEDSRFSHRS